MKMVDIEEVKRQLLDANPKDYFNETELKEIFKTSTNFKIDIGREGKYFMASDEPDKIVIQLTFEWLECPHEKKFGYNQTWYIDMKKYISNRRKKIINNFLK